MKATEKNYAATVDELVNRISLLIPSHPEILRIKNPFDLFRIKGFKCDDLQPSLQQASSALSIAKACADKKRARQVKHNR